MQAVPGMGDPMPSDAVPPSGGFSMSLSGKAKKPKPVAAATDGFEVDRPQTEEELRIALNEMVEGKAAGSEKPVLVIPAIGNTFALGGAQHLRPRDAEPAEPESAAAAPNPPPNLGCIPPFPLWHRLPPSLRHFLWSRR